jgi:hypothetical protein
MFGIDLPDLGSIVPGLDELSSLIPGGLDGAVDLALPFAASAVLGPVAGPIAAQFAAPLAKEILGGSSDPVVRDHRRPAFQVPTDLGGTRGLLLAIFKAMEGKKEALMRRLQGGDVSEEELFELKLAFEEIQNIEKMTQEIADSNNRAQQRTTIA